MSTESSSLYFGRLQKVFLVPSGGDSKLVEVAKWEFPLADEERCPEVLPWAQPVVLMENLDEAEEGSRLLFPQVPATVPEGRKGEKIETQLCLPLSIAQPLQKALESQLNDDKRVEVYVSGMRSAIKEEGEALYRFKGVGNGISNSSLHSIFPVRIVGQDDIRPQLDKKSMDYEDQKTKPIEIRGSMFNFTASREQAITSLVNHHLLKHKIPVANEPMGYYQYKEIQVQIPEKTEKSEISLCCGIYLTHGDKRLASHLLWGLELLIPFIFDINGLTLAINDSHPISSVPPSSSSDPSINASSSIVETHSHDEGMPKDEESPKSESTSVAVPSPPMPSNWILNRFPMSRKTFVSSENDMEVMDTGFSALEGNDHLISLPDEPIGLEYLSKYIENPMVPEGVDKEKWKDLWEEEWRNLKKLRKEASSDVDCPNIGELMGLVYWWIGKETGSVLKVIHEAGGVNWGTFEDLLGNHCNAHPNNFIVLKEGDCKRQLKSKEGEEGECKEGYNEGIERFLAPLDFDLAFTQSTFISNEKIEKWNELREMEVNAMRLALGGLNINSGVEGKSSLPSSLFEPIRISLRDTLVKSFSSSYHKYMVSKSNDDSKPSSEPVKSPDHYDPSSSSSSSSPSYCHLSILRNYQSQVHSLIRLALILSESILA